ncbi:MAG: hypothetical protein IPM66_09845 [Acidobacteriota bacterium]|nr:MAG: hypothetical protein IPM66_09845 [Acidobacteriota bacterium]
MENDHDPFDLSGGCTLDGMPVPCSFAFNPARVGASVAFSGATPSTAFVGGEYRYLRAFADGTYGLLPDNAFEVNGIWYDSTEMPIPGLSRSRVEYINIIAGDMLSNFLQKPDKANGQTINDLRNSIYNDQELLKKINDCLKQLLGANFSKVGEQTIANAPRIDARFTSEQIKAKFNMDAPPYATGVGHVGGRYGTIFIGSQFFNDPTQWTQSHPDFPGRTLLQNAYVHEVGNLARYRASGGTTYHLFGVIGATDEDSGYQLQLCVFGN